MNERIALTATAHPDEDRMLIEIYVDGENVAELVEGDGDYTLLVYPRSGGGPWSLPLALWSEAVSCARRRLDSLVGRAQSPSSA